MGPAFPCSGRTQARCSPHEHLPAAPAPTAGSPASPTASAPAGLPDASQPGSLQAWRPTRWPGGRPAGRPSGYDRCFAGQPSGWRAGRPAGRLAGQLVSLPACRSSHRPTFSRQPVWPAHRLGMGRLYNVAAESSLLSVPPLPSLYLNSKSPNGVKVPSLAKSHFRMPARCHSSACACIFPHVCDACLMPARCLRMQITAHPRANAMPAPESCTG